MAYDARRRVDDAHQIRGGSTESHRIWLDYLSLMEGDQLSGKEDRQLILQALFRPASDGIVKDEGVPFSLAEVLTRTGKP